jgi:hypothetical protein
MKHVAHTEFDKMILSSYRTEAQQVHGERVEERQRVNGQPNGYAPTSEADLQALRTQSFAAQYEG